MSMARVHHHILAESARRTLFHSRITLSTSTCAVTAAAAPTDIAATSSFVVRTFTPSGPSLLYRPWMFSSVVTPGQTTPSSARAGMTNCQYFPVTVVTCWLPRCCGPGTRLAERLLAIPVFAEAYL